MTDTSKPLLDTRVLVGRARHQASALAAALSEFGAEVIEIPFIEIRPPRSYKPLDSALKRIGKYEWMILTSVNGVDAVRSRLRHLGIKPEGLGAMKVAAIGPSPEPSPGLGVGPVAAGGIGLLASSATKGGGVQ